MDNMPLCDICYFFSSQLLLQPEIENGVRAYFLETNKNSIYCDKSPSFRIARRKIDYLPIDRYIPSSFNFILYSFEVVHFEKNKKGIWQALGKVSSLFFCYWKYIAGKLCSFQHIKPTTRDKRTLFIEVFSFIEP